MIAGGNVDGKLSGKKMEGDDNLRTVECLRGRLVAERSASRVATEDAELMGNKLTELENKMKEEIKSRNKAEKRLKLLMKKLDSLNLSSYCYLSENSSILEKSDMSSVSSSSSTNCANCEIQQSNTISLQKISHDLVDNASLTTAPDPSYSGSTEEFSEEKPNFEEPGGSEVNSSHDFPNPKTDDLSSSSTSDQAQDDHVDNSLALVLVDLPKAKESQRPDPLTLDARVRDVLDALRNAREKLQMSMESRHMIRVGSK